MKVIRTFHPIGQGAFYSERFFEGSESLHNVVFDCGTINVENNHKMVVRQAFTMEDTIDYLFISHLDEDHISLVTTLRDSVRSIRKVVLPYISPKNVVIHKILSQSLGLTEVYGFWSMVYDAIEGGISNDTNFMFVYTEKEDGGRMINDGRSFVYSGDQLPMCSDWIYIPYNKHIERKEDLENKLNELIQNPGFQKELLRMGLAVNTVGDLKDRITSADFSDLISSKVIKKYLQKAYHDLSGSINQNSLLVYSGPITEKHQYLIEGGPYHWFRFKSWFHGCERDKVACLFTGDSDLDMDGYNRDLHEFWYNIGTIQIPHHGSYASFQYEDNKDLFDEPRVFPVSCGETNRYGHPSSKVLAFLQSQGSFPIVVTEKVSTLFFQVITNLGKHDKDNISNEL